MTNTKVNFEATKDLDRHWIKILEELNKKRSDAERALLDCTRIRDYWQEKVREWHEVNPRDVLVASKTEGPSTAERYAAADEETRKRWLQY